MAADPVSGVWVAPEPRVAAHGRPLCSLELHLLAGKPRLPEHVVGILFEGRAPDPCVDCCANPRDGYERRIWKTGQYVWPSWPGTGMPNVVRSHGTHSSESSGRDANLETEKGEGAAGEG